MYGFFISVTSALVNNDDDNNKYIVYLHAYNLIILCPSINGFFFLTKLLFFIT